MGMTGTMLHVGCGNDHLPEWAEGCEEVRMDIDPSVRPDILASMLDMGNISDFDSIYTCHALEHIYPHEVPKALSEFNRVLREDGVAIIIVPDLEGVKATDEVIYISEAGPVCGLDIIYGMASLIEKCPFMAHHTGFTCETLEKYLTEAGFVEVSAKRIPNQSILATGKKKCE